MPMKLNKELVLGSKSPRRASLLSEMGFDFSVIVTEADENAPSHLDGEETAIWISEQKARALQPQLTQNQLGITSDTEVWLGNRRYGKPTDENEAKEMIRSLSGNTHDVITGLTLTTVDSIQSYCSTVKVTFETLSEEEIDYYVDQFKPLDKAGAYGIQEWIGHAMISAIHGEYNAVVGLPTSTLYKALKDFAE
jgi:septum formation protein